MKFDTATVLHAGDRVLLTLTDNGRISRDQIDTTQAELAARFPGVEFTFVNGVNAVHVLPVMGSQETTAATDGAEQ